MLAPRDAEQVRDHSAGLDSECEHRTPAVEAEPAAPIGM
jgi:hypothetical protein